MWVRRLNARARALKVELLLGPVQIRRYHVFAAASGARRLTAGVVVIRNVAFASALATIQRVNAPGL